MLTMLSVYVNYLFSYLDRDDGQDFIEYALIVGLIVIGAIVAMTAMGDSITAIFQSISSSLGTALGG